MQIYSLSSKYSYLHKCLKENGHGLDSFSNLTKPMRHLINLQGLQKNTFNEQLFGNSFLLQGAAMDS